MENKIVFLHSISPRSGHNFVAEVIRLNIKTETPLGLRSEIPFGVFIKNYKDFKSSTFGSANYPKYFDELFIDGLRDRILTNGNVLIKNTSLVGAEEVKKMFPNDIHIISIRNPKDVLSSVFKGMKFRKNVKSKIKKILLPTGLYHYWYAKRYSIKMLKALPNLHEFLVLKYEDLVQQNDYVLIKLQEKLGATAGLNELKKRMNDIKVINTSFFKEETNAEKVWANEVKTEKFNPLNRKNLSYHKRKLIDLGSQKLIKALNY